VWVHHFLDLFGVPPIVFPTKGVHLFTSQRLFVMPCYSWNYYGHEKQMPTRTNTLTCSYSLIVILVLNYVQEVVIWGIMIKCKSLESNKHFSWNFQCSERLWIANTWTIHSWHQSLFERSRCGETRPMVLIICWSLLATNGLKIVFEFKTNVLIQAWNVCLTLGCNLKHLLHNCDPFQAEM
jgi:hypothetical protein